jgi:hypothetical protein
VSFSVKKFKEWYADLAKNSSYTARSYEWTTNSKYLIEAARWGYSEAERSAENAYNEGEANGKIIGYDLAVAEMCPDAVTPLKQLPAWKQGFTAAQNEFTRLLEAERRSIRVRAYLTKTQRQLLWLEIDKLEEKAKK